MDEPHEVTVLCRCEDVDWCIVGQYIADVRYLYLQAQRLRFERDCLSGYVSGIEGRGVPVERYFAQRAIA